MTRGDQDAAVVLDGCTLCGLVIRDGKDTRALFAEAGIDVPVREEAEEDTETIAGEAPAIGGLPSFGGSKSKFRATMNARIIDAETGEIVWADEASGASGGFKLRVGGLGGGKERSPGAQFDAALRPIILQLCASIDGAEL